MKMINPPLDAKSRQAVKRRKDHQRKTEEAGKKESHTLPQHRSRTTHRTCPSELIGRRDGLSVLERTANGKSTKQQTSLEDGQRRERERRAIARKCEHKGAQIVNYLEEKNNIKVVLLQCPVLLLPSQRDKQVYTINRSNNQSFSPLNVFASTHQYISSHLHKSKRYQLHSSSLSLPLTQASFSSRPQAGRTPFSGRSRDGPAAAHTYP